MLDPAGLLLRIPELREIAAVAPVVAEAVAMGDPHVVCRSLGSVPSGAPEKIRLAARQLQREPWKFFRGLQSPLREWGGFGFGPRFSLPRPVGQPPTGAVSAFRFHLFGLPLFPMAEVLWGYDEAGNRFVQGEMPPRAGRSLHRGLALLLVVGVAVAGTFAAVQRWAVADVFLTHGLDLTVNVQLGDEQLSLAPGAILRTRLVQGSYPMLAATTGGATVERRTVHIDGSQSVYLLDLLGSAPIRETTSGGAITRCGEAELARGTVGVAFGERLGRASTELEVEAGGWRRCVAVLQAGGRPQEAAALARDSAGLSPENEEGMRFAAGLVRDHLGNEEEAAWLAPIATAREFDGVTQGLYLAALLRVGRRDDAIQRYSAFHTANPQLPMAAMLHIDAAADPVVRESLTDAALLAHPGDPELLRRRGMARLYAGKWGQADDALTAAATQSPGLATELRPAMVSARMSAGKVGSAVALLVEGNQLRSTDHESMRLLLAAVRRSPVRLGFSVDQALSQFRAAYEPNGEAAELAVLLSLGDDVLDARLLAVPDEADRSLLGALARLGREPVVALRRLALVGDTELARVDSASWILFRGEAVAEGNTELQVRLDRVCPLDSGLADAVRAFIAGSGEQVGLEPLLPEHRAATLVARSRQASARGQGAVLRMHAIELDPVQGIVTVAARNWPANR